MKRIIRRVSLLVLAAVAASLLATVPALGTAVSFQTMTDRADPNPVVVPARADTPVTFHFWVMHPVSDDVTGAELVIANKSAVHRVVARVPIPVEGINVVHDWAESDPPPPDQFTWDCDLRPGYYEWYVSVTINGATNTAHDQGHLRVVRHLR